MIDNEILHAIQEADSEEVIQHYGVKGMKWGFRRIRQRLADRKVRKQERKRSKETLRKWNKRYNNRSSMSNSDLQRAVNRLRLENDFAEQINRTTRIHTKPKNGDSFAKEIGKDLVKSTIKDSTKILTREGINYVKKNPDKAAKFVKGVNTWMNT